MSIASQRARRTHQPTFAELYSPKLVTVLREGYGLADFRADLISGLTVAIVALPLSMAIAIAAGGTPDRALYGRGGRLHRFALGRQPVPDRRTRRRLHRAGVLDRRTPRARRRHPRHPDGRGVSDRGGTASPRYLYQIHSVSGDGRIHRRDRRHHLF